MFENLEIPYTIIKKPSKEKTDERFPEQFQWKTLLSESSLKFEVENINLNQEPNETLNMTICFSKLNNETPKLRLTRTPDGKVAIIPDHYIEYSVYDESTNRHNIVVHYQYTYMVELKFHNYLHEFNKNYFYEIVCKIPAHGNEIEDEFVFCFVKPRLDSTITTEKKILSVKGIKRLSSMEKAYFCLRRYNKRKSDESCNLISTLRNIGCDIVLKAKDDQVLAHKSVLTKKSLVFEHMFAHEMIEKQDGIVNMSDFEVKVISKMLDFLYTNQLHNISGMEQQLFKLAHLYQIHELCLRCEQCCIFNVKPNSGHIVEILELAKLYDLGELEKSAVSFVECHENDLCQLPSYQQYLCQSVDQANVIRILTSAHKYNMINVKMTALNFIRANYQELIEQEDFLYLFESNPGLMKEVFIYSNKKQNI